MLVLSGNFQHCKCVSHMIIVIKSIFWFNLSVLVVEVGALRGSRSLAT